MYSVKPVEASAEPIIPIPGLTPELMLAIHSETQKASKLAIEHSTTLAERMFGDILKQVRVELAGVKPKPQILVVEVDQNQRKLSKPASPLLPRLLVNAKLGLNSLLVGPAGSGKTIAASQVAESLGLEFGHVCLTAGASETWLFGRQTPNGFVEAPFSRLYRNGGVFLGDELDAADANLLLAINTALANGSMANPITGEMIQRHKDFVFIGAANTIGRGGDAIYTGRNRLDAATLDRFVILQLDYSPEIEEQVCPDDELREVLQSARKKLRELNSQEIISTRGLERAFLQKQAGVPVKDIFDSLTAGWPEELVVQAIQPPKPNKAKKAEVAQQVVEKKGSKYEPF